VRGYFVRSTAVATVQIRLVIAAAGMAVESRKENIEISTPDQLGGTWRGSFGRPRQAEFFF
jgi:hypothetical protein